MKRKWAWDAKCAEEAAREAAREAQATTLLQEAGAFRRGTGIRSPRSERDARAETVRWEDWMTRRVREFYRHPGEDLDALAEILRLSPDQKAALQRHKLEELTLKQTADVMGTRVWHVRTLLLRAQRKCALRRHEPPVSARALYWEEVRQKAACVYRRPYKARAFSKKARRKLLEHGHRSARNAPHDWS